MKKTFTSISLSRERLIKLLIMRTTILLMLFCAVNVSATTHAQNQKLNLNVQNATFNEVVDQLQKQSDFYFIYKSEDIPITKRITANLKSSNIAQVMDLLLKGTNLKYKVIDKYIAIANKGSISIEEPQQKQLKITGKVTDNNGQPMPGVTVAVIGTQRAVITDALGMYSLSLNANDKAISFSFIGMKRQEVKIDGQAVINVSLESEATTLDEVVVVAYGRQKKATVTGAITSIQTREIKQSPAANLSVTLAGRLPGLTAIQRSGEPGNDFTQLFIRGQGTINAQSPIVLVDGLERDLTYIDPQEVESVTILKDASSTAIFGVRGANGVILVTTRRGTSEKPEINFSSEFGLQNFTRFPKTLNSYDYAVLKNLTQANDGLGPAFSSFALEHYKTGDDPLRYPNTDWRKMLIKDFSTQQRYNLNVSGGTKNAKYFLNAGYLNQGGQFNIEKNLKYDPSFFLKRYNFRSNIDIQLNKSLKAFLNVAGYLEKQNSPFGVNGNIPSVYILASIFNRPATVPGPVTPDGQAVITDYGGNPPAYGLINRTGYKQNTRSNITASYGMEQDLDFITKGLSAKAILSFDSRAVNDLYASKSYAASVQVIDPNLRGADGQDSVYFKPLNNNKNTPLNLYNGFGFTTFTNTQAFLNYNRTFNNKHAVSGLVLYQQQQTIIGAQLPFNLRGFSTRITYGYDNRYLAEFNAGYNGSEQFAKARRFGFFPAASVGWVVSNEKFMADNKVITQLKVRGSYGKVGNDRISGLRFLYLDDIQANGGGYSGSLDFGQQISENLLKNENLQWEVSTKSNIGFELGLFRDFNLVIDVYKEKRDNVLRLRGTVPILNGLPTNILPPVNIGVIENKGYEIEFNYKKAINTDFSLFSKINFNYAHNKQLYADEPLLPDNFAYRYRQTGYEIGQQFGYIVEGYFQDQADIDKSPVQALPGHGSRPGDFKYKDMNKDGFINERDQAPIGYSAVPEYTYGAAFGINYKGLDLSVLFQGITNVTNYYNGDGVAETLNFVERHKQSWTPERVANGEAINYPRLTGQTSPNNIPNSFFLMDGSYLRLKNMEIGFTIPGSWSKKIGSKRIRFYANGFNLLTWDKLPTKDFDPEVQSANSYPLTRLYNFGVNIVF